MTGTVFQSTMTSSEEREELVSLKEHTLVMKFTENNGMFYLTSELVGEAVLRVLKATDVVALGSLRGNHEWHLTLATREALATMIAAERQYAQTWALGLPILCH